MQPLRIFVGFDSRETAAFHVLSHSILRHASRPVAIIPLVQAQLRAAGVYTRPTDEGASTEFSLTRFLVPYLSGYEGASIFMDCDMLAKRDLTLLAPDGCQRCGPAVHVARHEYTPKAATKMDGQAQTAYPRKNWSSVVVFNNARCTALSLSYVNCAPAADLHRFAWLRDEEIGGFSLEWNWLVGEYPKNPDAKILHFTNGGPWFRGYEACDHAEDWYRERERMLTGKVVA